MYQLHGSLKASKGNGNKLAEILIEASKAVSVLDECKLYIISKDRTDSDIIWITEIWQNKEAHDNSLKLDSVRILIGKAMPLLGGMPEKGQELEFLGGYGV
ncbi:MAG: antibiotic biosynthesis monooxygenase [Ignavibacteriae bacterium]|nr:antibiotic biosynthesis monooxygenase [Ignavibacteriota bacterium]MCB9208015.1 antibiotic biosynthesis monooxygenase [Ignavibacteriales bacterium]MCB9258784.1 antibiotic biosynthesis monooxygenase [Ignavibacteriales bacterium]